QIADEQVRGRHRGSLLQIVQPELSTRYVDERGDQSTLQGAGSVAYLRTYRHRHREFAIAGARPHSDLVEQLAECGRRRVHAIVCAQGADAEVIQVGPIDWRTGEFGS